MSDTLSVCGLTICRGSKLRTMLPVPGTEIEIPLTIINGAFDGPTLLVTAGIHGGEYPGIAAAMELGRSLDPQEIHESLHPYVYYPGQPTEELAAKARSVAKVLNVEYMVRSMATSGAYNYAASTGLPSLLIERGGAGLCLHEDIEEYKSDLKNIMRKLGLLNEPVKPRRYIPRDVTDIIYLEAQETGCWLHHIHSGDFVEEGQILGRTTDLFGETLTTYYAKQSGIVLYVCPALSAPQGTVLLAYGKIHNED